VVFLVAAPLAAIALLVVLRLPEVELRAARAQPARAQAPLRPPRTSTAR
jgi:hypothetical protein